MNRLRKREEGRGRTEVGFLETSLTSQFGGFLGAKGGLKWAEPLGPFNNYTDG